MRDDHSRHGRKKYSTEIEPQRAQCIEEFNSSKSYTKQSKCGYSFLDTARRVDGIIVTKVG